MCYKTVSASRGRSRRHFRRRDLQVSFGGTTRKTRDTIGHRSVRTDCCVSTRCCRFFFFFYRHDAKKRYRYAVSSDVRETRFLPDNYGSDYARVQTNVNTCAHHAPKLARYDVRHINFSAIRVSREKFDAGDAKFVADYASINDAASRRSAPGAMQECNSQMSRAGERRERETGRCLRRDVFTAFLLLPVEWNDARYRKSFGSGHKSVETSIDLRLFCT